MPTPHARVAHGPQRRRAGRFGTPLISGGIISAALFTNSITALGVAVPSSPGFVGTFQALVVKSLEAFEIDRTLAFTYSIGFHAMNYLSVTLVGLVYFFREGLSWKELERSEEELERELVEEYETVIEPSLERDDHG